MAQPEEQPRQTAKDNDRVAQALRANLARRKQQQKARATIQTKDNTNGSDS